MMDFEYEAGSTKNETRNINANQNPIQIRFNSKNFEIKLKLILVFVVFAQIIPFNMLAKNIIANIISINDKMTKK